MKPIEKGTHTKERKKDHWSLTVFEPLQTGKYLKPVSSFSYNALGFNKEQCPVHSFHSHDIELPHNDSSCIISRSRHDQRSPQIDF